MKDLSCLQISVRLRMFLVSSLVVIFSSCTKNEDKDHLVRLAVIEVDTAQVDRYHALLAEEIEASIAKEPGVITLYGVSEKDNPGRVTLFETYADSIQYKAHLVTPHFQKYKQGTLQMVKRLELIETEPILYIRKAELSNAQRGDLFIRLIKMKIHPQEIEQFKALAENVMLPGVKNEPGVLLMYAVSEKNEPGNISILEVYASRAAYENHLSTPHFLKYKAESKKMVRTLDLVDVNAIVLGSKPQP